MSGHLDQRRLFDALDGQCTAQDRAHLDACAACQRALAGKQAAMQALHLAAARPPSPQRVRQQADRFLDSLPAAAAQPPAARWWLALGAAAAAGACVVVLAQTGLDHLQTPRAGGPQAERIARAPQPAGAPAQRAATAADEVAPEALALPSPPLTIVAPVPELGPVGDSSEASRLQVKSNHSNNLEGIYSAESLVPAAPQPGPASEQTAADQLLQQLDRLEHGVGDDAMELLQEFPMLLRVAARQLEPQQLEVVAQRIAALALSPPANEMASVLACETALLARSYPSALALCRSYLQRFPQGRRARDVAFLAATTARVQLGDCASAIPLYDQALTFSGVLQSFNDEAYLGRARCRLEQGDAAGARSDLNLFLFKYPERRRGHELRGLLEQLEQRP